MNRVKKLGALLAVALVVLSIASPLWAQVDEKKHTQDVEKIKAEAEKYKSAFSGPALGAGLGAGLVIIGAALGFGRIGAAALESMARQPETAGRVQTAMIIIGALLEGVAFFALVICFTIANRS